MSKPYGKDMFVTGGKNSNLGAGISSLAGFSEENRKTEGSGYQQDFAAVYEYNQMMKQLKDKQMAERNQKATPMNSSR